MQLQTILKPNPQICRVKELYFHEQADCVRVDGLFNLFYIDKRKKYTILSDLRLKLRLKGWREIHLMHNQEEFSQEQLTAAAELNYEFPLPYAKQSTGVFWFWLKRDVAASEDFVLDGYYEGVADRYNQVNLAVDICTYRREDYVFRNMQSICARIFSDSNLEVGKHLQVMLIDNGKTLKQHAQLAALIESESRIHLYQNKNAGGAGGFTRGMLEAINQNEQGAEISHLLLMDDDAVFDPDLFVRLYGFLTLLAPKYRDLTVGGSLMREENPHLQYACGERFEAFSIHNLFPWKDMREFSNCMLGYMQQAVYPVGTYSGWWCCCYSMKTIRKDNLPIPLFIHHDDIEYGIRNQEKGIVFLNGIGVWHRGFELTFAGANRYYDVRNALITTALHDAKKSRWSVLKYVWKSMTRMLISYRYAEAEFSYEGLQDFCRGPQWLLNQDPEELNNRLRARMQLESYEKLRNKMQEQPYQTVIDEIRRYTENFSVQNGELRCDMPGRKRLFELMKRVITFNGWILPGKCYQDKKIKVLSPVDSPFEVYREKEVILFEPFTQKAMLAKRDYHKLFKMMYLYAKAFFMVILRYQHSVRAYQHQIGKITSYTAWKRYLNL